VTNRIFAIGDIQGCFTPLKELLDKVAFDPSQDKLWFCGDLVNRGPESLDVLRYVKNLDQNAITVLGNHDIHFLAVALGITHPRPKDTFQQLLQAPDKDELIDWLRKQPLLHTDKQHKFAMAHAGIYPTWSWQQTQECALEAEQVLGGENYIEFLKLLYGNKPSRWDPDLTGHERIRFIVNAFTRMRFCDRDAHLDLKYKGPPGTQPDHLMPWFEHPQLDLGSHELVFGHWSTLGMSSRKDIHALDTGCIWGGQLSAFELNSRILTRLDCEQIQKPSL
jgi:bis(5'-nucleosyl)-tetraphosphatase (symmetrical)